MRSLFQRSRAESYIGITRSLENIHGGLARLGAQGKVEGFFKNVENAGELSGVVEDIRDAVIDYQVCS